MPQLADVRVVRMWTGVMAFTDDLQPIVGEVGALPGYFALIATTGFTLSPMIARLLPALIAPPGFTLSPMIARLLGGHIPRQEPLPREYAPDRRPVSTTGGD